MTSAQPGESPLVGPTPVISVVIGTFNGSRTIEGALVALENQVTSVPFEVIVVNDASNDDTVEIVKGHDVRVIELTENAGHGHTLNVGLAEARGEFMAMMDDDCVPPPQWIEALATTWSSLDPSVSMIGGLVEPLETDTINRRYVEYRRPLTHQEAGLDDTAGFWRRVRYAFAPPEPAPGPRTVYYTVGANMSVRVSAARLVGGFTESRGAGEEESIARPLRAIFGPDTVRLFPDIVMHHNFDRSLRDTFRRSRSYGRAHGRDWIRARDIPTLSPVPLAAGLLSAMIAPFSPVIAGVTLVGAPLILYRRWWRRLRERGLGEAVLYPYIRAVEDLAGDVGFVQGALKELRSANADH